MNRVISFSSGKGGVGKTSVVASLGWLLSRRGKKVLLVDGDWSLGKLSITLGVRPKNTIEKVLSGEISLGDAVQEVSPNLCLLASPTGVLGFEEMSEPARHQIYWDFEMLRDRFDYILFDHSSGLHWGVLQFAAASHQHVIVTTAEPTSYTDAYAIMKILSRRFGIKEFELLVTMGEASGDTAGIMSRFSDIAVSQLGIRLRTMDILTYERQVSESIRKQKPFAALFPNHALTAQLERICDDLDRARPAERHGLSFFQNASNDETTQCQR